MPANKPNSNKNYRLRANVPLLLRIFAVAAGAVIIFVVIAGFYREHSRSPFKLKSEHTQLSTEVVADVNGYERVETENGLPKYHITADHAKTFSDDHQELENVNLETYDVQGNTDNKMASDKALFVPEADKNFTAYLNGNVCVETRDALKVNTNNLVYTKRTGIVDLDEAVQFERDNVRGRSFGATVKLNDRAVELLRDVEIEAFDSPELARSNVRYARMNSVSASFNMADNRVTLNQNVAIGLNSAAKGSPARTTEIKAARAIASFSGGDESKARQFNSVELFDGVNIASQEAAGPLTTIEGGYALYDRSADRFQLKNNTHIVTTVNARATDIKAIDAVYEQTAGKLALTGGAEITQESDYLKGDNIYADLFPDRKVKSAIARGNAAVRRTTPDRTVTASAPELNVSYGETRQLHDANAAGTSVVEISPAANASYSGAVLHAAKGVGMIFKGEGLLESLKTDGRTTIQLNAPAGTANAANKRVTADSVTTQFSANGKDFRRAEAVGNAELYIEPLSSGAQVYRTTITAQRFDCDFFTAGGDVRLCEGSRKVTAVRVPTVQLEGHGKQVLNADRMAAEFDETSRDLAVLKASGGARFNELDRYAIAAEIAFTQADETVRLRGGEPTAWDSRYRAKAREIDWDTRRQHSWLRGGVSTTYYSLKTMGSSAPFAHSDKPVFLTAENAEMDQPTETAVYAGNARGWQENNYVRGDKFTIYQREGRFVAEEHVQSAVYNARLSGKTAESAPVFASAGSMVYLRDSNLLQYRVNTDIRQGTDRITSASADVYLNEKNEVSKTIAENSVVVTQPGRRATGDWVQYTIADETAVLRGSPARIEDAENGTSQSAQLTFYMRDKRVISDGRSKQAASGRTRSTYKVQTKP